MEPERCRVNVRRRSGRDRARVRVYLTSSSFEEAEDLAREVGAALANELSAWRNIVPEGITPGQSETFFLDPVSQTSVGVGRGPPSYGQNPHLEQLGWERIVLGRRFTASAKPSVHIITAIKVLSDWWQRGLASPTLPYMHPKARSLADLLWMAKFLLGGAPITPSVGTFVRVSPPTDLGALAQFPAITGLTRVQVPLHQVVNDLDVHAWCSRVWGISPTSWNLWDVSQAASSPRCPSSTLLLFQREGATVTSQGARSRGGLHAAWDLEFIRHRLSHASMSRTLAVFWRYGSHPAIYLPSNNRETITSAVSALLPVCIRTEFGSLQPFGSGRGGPDAGEGTTFTPDSNIALSCLTSVGGLGGSEREGRSLPTSAASSACPAPHSGAGAGSPDRQERKTQPSDRREQSRPGWSTPGLDPQGGEVHPTTPSANPGPDGDEGGTPSSDAQAPSKRVRRSPPCPLSEALARLLTQVPGVDANRRENREWASNCGNDRWTLSPPPGTKRSLLLILDSWLNPPPSSLRSGKR